MKVESFISKLYIRLLAQIYRKTAFVSGHFIFGSSQWAQEVPYDPWLYFTEEETALAARLWTSGWDIFRATEAVIWHKYYSANARPHHWNDISEWEGLNRRSFQRVRHLLGMEHAPSE